MAYLPPHKRHPSAASDAPSPTGSRPTPSSLSSSLRSLSLSSPHGRGRGRGRHPHASERIIHAAGCVSRWSPIPPFPDDGEGEGEAHLRLEPFPCGPVELKTGAKPVALVASPSPPDGSSDTPAAAAAILERFFPDLLAAAERARAGDAPKEQELVKLSLVARLGKVVFQCQPGGSPVSLYALREAAILGEVSLRSDLRKWFYTHVPSECLDGMEQEALKTMGLQFDSCTEFYTVKVCDKHKKDSTISCKCIFQEDGRLAIRKVELNQVRHLVEDISCLLKDLDLRLMLSTKRIQKNLDSEVETALESLVSTALIDPNAKGGLRWPLGKESVGERFTIVGVWHTNCKGFRSESLRLKLRRVDRFDHETTTGEVSNEVTFKLDSISRKLEEGDQDNSVKEMLESVVQMIWDNALKYEAAA